MKNGFIRRAVAFVVVALLSACSGGGGGVAGGNYTVSGSVSGLSGSGLILQNNGTDDLVITAVGAFTFATPVANGGTYAVTVKTQPAGQTCSVNNGSGTVAGANVTNVSVVCSTLAYAVGGTVTGLTGSGLVLQNNSGDDLNILADGTFSFGTSVANGANYSVTVKTQPSNPTQVCTASNNTGTIAGTAITNVSVVCATSAYTVGGTVSGYTSSGLVLQDNGADDLPVSADGSFTFASGVADGSNYAVTVKTQPAGQTCAVTGGSGSISGANVTGVAVTCADNPKHTVGGTINGMVNAGLILQNNAGDDLTPSGNGTFTFTTPIAEGMPYLVTVKTQPPGSTCSVGNAAGTMGNGNVSNVSVVCASMSYTVGGNVSGMSGGTLVLQNNGSDDLNITGTGNFTFSTPVANGSAYAVTVKTQPSGQICSVVNGTGTVSAANVTQVSVTCNASAYTVGGIVSGLTGTGLVLQNNAGDDRTLSANGAFTFSTPLADNSGYHVTVKTQPNGQTCSVTNGSGAINGANVTNVSVTCASSYTLFVTTTGLSGTMTVAYNGTPSMTTSYNGTNTPLKTVLDGSSYAVTISTQPTNQTCTVANGTGTVSGADVTNISITCATNTFTVGGTESGLLAGKTLVLQNNGGDDLTVTGLFFTFVTKIAIGDTYNVTVKTQPSGQVCTVSNGSGIMPASNVTDVSVICSTTSFSIGGTASGLSGPVELQNNGGDDLTVAGNGPFAFLSFVANNAGYDVTVKTSGPAQYCSVAAGSGTVSGADVSNVALSCSTAVEHFAYAGSVAAGGIGVYSLDATGGNLASSPTSTNSWSIVSVPSAVTPNGKFLYLANSTAKTVSAFMVNASTGALSSIASYATGTSPNGIAIDPTSSFLYVTNFGSNTVSGFTIDGSAGTLTEMSGSPFISGNRPGNINIDSAGTHLYVAGDSPGTISEYDITPATGVLTPISGSPFTVASLPSGKKNPMAVTVSSDGKYAYVPDYWGNQIVVYNVDGSGALTTEIAGSPSAAGTHPRAIAVFDPTGNYLYASNEGNSSAGSGTLSAYSVNKVTGALTELAGSPYTIGTYAGSVIVDTTGRFVFVNGSSSIAAFRRDLATGQLTPVQGSPFLTNAKLYAVTP